MNAEVRQPVDELERTSRVLTLAVAATAIVAAFLAPLIAISWSNQPFPGFLFEQRLVVNDIGGAGWTGRARGLDYPQHIMRAGGVEVETSAQYQAVISSFEIGQQVPFFAKLPEESGQLYPSVRLIAFPPTDFFRLFWVPYLIGVAYLIIGAWIYRLKGQIRPGRALAFFCFCVAVTCILFFDLFTTHVGTVLWLLGLAQIGGALISLALRFPEEARPVARSPWILGVPYMVSIGLALWAIIELYRPDPWAYIPPRYVIYRYAAVGIVVFLGTMLYRARVSKQPVVKQQARIVMVGSLLAFAPLTIWFVAPLVGRRFHFNDALFLAPLIIFPLAVALAIFRYRLLQVDAFVNRTLLAGVITAILAGVITASISLTQKVFLAVTGEKSDAAAVIATLIVVSLFEPVKSRSRSLIDRFFKEAPDSTKELRAFGDEVKVHLEITDAAQITRRLLEEAARGLQAESGAVNLLSKGQLVPVYVYGRWRGEAWMSIPLEYEGKWYGLLLIGPTQDRREYTRQECDAVQQVAGTVARAVHLAMEAHHLGAAWLQGDGYLDQVSRKTPFFDAIAGME